MNLEINHGYFLIQILTLKMMMMLIIMQKKIIININRITIMILLLAILSYIDHKDNVNPNNIR